MNVSTDWLTEDDAGITLTLRVAPRARKSEIAGLHGEALKVRLAAPPVEGAANRALVAFLADCLGLRPQQISIEGGERSRQKRVCIVGVTAGELLEQLSARLEA